MILKYRKQEKGYVDNRMITRRQRNILLFVNLMYVRLMKGFERKKIINCNDYKNKEEYSMLNKCEE